MKTSKQIESYRHECVDIYKMSKGCELCGYNELPYNLCFDHLPEYDKSDEVKNGYSKRSSAGGMYRLYAKKHSLDKLISEIKKCRILCSHCHMQVTHYRNKRSIHNINKKIETVDSLEKTLNEYESC
jgi:hypothetical protein